MVGRVIKRLFSMGILGLLLAVSCPLLMIEASDRRISDEDFYPCVDLRVEEEAEQPLPKDDLQSSISLKMDQAELVISSKVSVPVKVCALSDICHQCPPVQIADLHPGHNQTVKMDSRFKTYLLVYHNNKIVCSLYERLWEHGQYFLWVNNMGNPNSSCNFYTNHQPLGEFIPIYVMLGGIVAVIITWILLKAMYRRGWLLRFMICMETERLINDDLGAPLIKDESDSINKPEDAPPPKTRLKSLDAFRGFALIVMIFVNYYGGGYWFFHHSTWNGLTVADIVFPWFIFIMGTSIALAFKGMLRRSSRKQLLFKVLKRSMILFSLGLVISNHAKHGKEVDLTSLRILGVLQRIALTYLVVGLTEVMFARADNTEYNQSRWWTPVRDLVPYWPEWLICLSLVAVHTCLTFLLPVPDCPTGYQGPGGLHENGIHGNCTGGAAGYIDRVVLGERHLYGHPTCMKVYYPTAKTLPYDPEGILGTLTAIVICFLGLQAGKILVCYEGTRSRVVRWTIWALVTGAIAGLLCKFTQNDGWIPINKNLWSLSFVLALGSMAFLLLAVFYLLIDVFKIWSGAPFIYTGMNSILIYMSHELFADYFPVSFHIPDTHAAHLALSAWGTTIWLVVSIILYYKGVFVAI